MDKKNLKKAEGLGWFTTSLFIVADMAGGGVVAMPVAMLQSGSLAGLMIILVLCITFCYTAHILSENWLILRERWSDYDEHCRKPYPEMAYRAMGSRARTLCSSSLNAMLFGVSVVYLLLSSHIINDVVSSVTGKNIGFCIMLLIVALMLWPITLLKSPQDFWWAIVVAMLTTLLSVILIIAGTVVDYPVCGTYSEGQEVTLSSIILSLGTFMFGFGGHAVFPTIQHDMKRPRLFTQSAIVAFFIVALMYTPISIFGYITYGNSLEDSIINSIQTNWMQQAANIFIAIHCILTLTIVINPLNQEVEHFFKIPHSFSWHRVVVRTVVMICVVFIAETIPKFGPILNVIGGTAVALTSAVMPSLYNLYLRASLFQESEKKYKRPNFYEVITRTSKLRLLINIFVIVIAVVCGAATTYSAIIEMASVHFTKPCYLSVVEEFAKTGTAVTAHCCGPWRNISRFDNAICSAALI